MPRLQIHFEKGDVHQIQADGYVTVRELQQEYLSAKNVPNWHENEREWTTRHRRTNMVLELDRTLDQHGLVDGDELYISRQDEGGANIETGADLQLDVSGPDGKNHHAEMPPDTATEELLKDLIEVWKLRPGSWELVDRQSDKKLDWKRTLSENGVATGQRLYLKQLGSRNNASDLVKQGSPCWRCQADVRGMRYCPRCGTDQQRAPEFKLEVVGPDGKRHRTEMPSDKATRELLKDLIEVWKLPAGNWVLVDQQTHKKLDSKKTLAENGVATGQRLYLSQPVVLTPPVVKPDIPDLKLEVVDQDRKRHQVAISPNTRTEEFVNDLKDVLKLQPDDWVLWDQQRNQSLSPKKTLAENSVTTGQRLFLRKRAPFWDWKKIALVLGLIAFILLGIMIARQFLAVTVSLEPRGPVSLAPSGTQQFTATVKNGSQGVSWSISPEVGKISSTGTAAGNDSKRQKHATYEAPASITSQQSVTLTIRSVDSPAKTATTEVVLVPDVSVTPSSVTLEPGHSAQFAADADVNWSLNPAAGTITPEGVYTAPQDVPADPTVAVIASRKTNSASSGRATISLISTPNPPVATQVVVSPRSVALDANGRFQFHATVTTAGGQVGWSLSPAVGQISERGLYTAPATISHDRSVSVTASASSVSPGTATIRLKAVALTPIEGPRSVTSNESITLRTMVLHSPDGEVRWTIEPQVGSISPQGVYTPPAAIDKPVNVTVVATSQADLTKSAPPFVIRVIPSGPEITIKLNHYNNVMHESERQTLSATVTGTSNTAVTFSTSGAGKLVPDGTFNNVAYYTAPQTIPPGGTRVTIIAVSNANPTKSVTGSLTLLPRVAKQ